MLPSSCGPSSRHFLKRILLHILFHCDLSQGIEYSSLCSTLLLIHPTYNSLHQLTPNSQSIPLSPAAQPSLSKPLPPSLLFTLSWRSYLLIHQENWGQRGNPNPTSIFLRLLPTLLSNLRPSASTVTSCQGFLRTLSSCKWLRPRPVVFILFPLLSLNLVSSPFTKGYHSCCKV